MPSPCDHQGLLSHGRRDEEGGQDGFLNKMARRVPPVSPHSSCCLLGSTSSSGGQMQMLCFSSSSNAVLDRGSSGASMQGVLAKVRGPFTPTQWMELEHQALIYKHIVANAPVPASLLLPIRRSIHPSGLPFSSSSLGWGAFHLAYSGSADAEPGRCRRTDGKKWRCSRDAVADQKYCERHINRGRHRSRKHVEGRSSHAVKAAMPTVLQPASTVSGGGSSGSRAMAQKPAKSLAGNVVDPCPTQFDRMLLDKQDVINHVQDATTLSIPNSMNQNTLENIFQKSKGINPFEETSTQVDHAAASANSLMNTPQTESLSFISQSRLNFVDEGKQSDRTQLSISIPMDSSDFSSLPSSPNREKLTLSPMNLPHDHDQAGIGLGAGSSSSEGNKEQASWVPVCWETSVDGPLGEVFKSKSCPSASLNLSTDGWTTSPYSHSPTGVLQLTNFSSVSSSTVSSPRLENHVAHGSHGSLFNVE